MTYSELQVTTHFSFLRGVSSAEELFSAAALMGMPALGICDRNSVGGIVRGLVAAEAITKQGCPIRMVAGCRLDLVDGASILVWPEDRAAWSRLTRLLSKGKLRADPKRGEKGKCFLHWEDVAEANEGLVGALVPGMADEGDPLSLRWMADVFGTRGHVALTPHRRPGEALRLHNLAEAARRHGLTPLATGDVLYHTPDKRMLQDVVTAIREKCTIDELGFRRERSADRHLKTPEDMARRFARFPEALDAVEAIVERCTFNPRDLDYQYPDEIVMTGRTPQEALERLAHNALDRTFGGKVPPDYRALLDRELSLVRQMGYAPYFLTVNSIVSYARSEGILCQGRGSAANSMICYVLGITSIDPIERGLLFERFISEERHEPPDIDVDFEHERREEVIQWIYETYGHNHAALTAVVSRFRSRGAIREVGKALGLSEDLTGALAGQVWGVSGDGIEEKHSRALGVDTGHPRVALAIELANELVGMPRHLSQHPGGFVLTRDRLDTLIPIEPAAMPDRWVIEWEKLDIEELGFMKVDVLGLGMLGCMRCAFELMAEHKGHPMTLDSPEFQNDDKATFDMICKADTLGVFQIESRAQMSMLPRMRPRIFYDLVIQVAIVRPGPIQGDMVHPYLRRREGKEPVEYPNEALRDVLEKTKGVPLFQEQAMRVAIVGADFTGSEADKLRKAMATFKATGNVGEFRPKLIEGMLRNGISLDFAERMVKQIEGFANYGFPESHAASFAKIAYASSWMKAHHPDVFCAALLNAQPMGFYAPAQIVRDAREHGVEFLPPCINASAWDTCLAPGERTEKRERHPGFYGTDEEWEALAPLRLGLRIVSGVGKEDVEERLLKARAAGPFTSVEDVWRRSGVRPAVLERLARADAFRCFGHDRRQALWAVRALGEKPMPLGLADRREPSVALTPLTAGREVVEDYRAIQLSLRAHPVSFLRGRLDLLGVTPAAGLKQVRSGRKVEVAGVILVRQRPATATGVLFLTLEDETGIANAIVWRDRFEAQRRTIMTATMIGVQGEVQREGEVIHIIVDRIVDYSDMLREVGAIDLPRLAAPGDGAASDGPPRHPQPPRSGNHWRSRRDEDSIPIRSHDFH
ncbi:error-prone DNA polymerase [Sphingomonas cannabina]|uniref:error-prone DNA polymerase n=1 Tax=Sphingomonas cannabina TaxID=2899123 RepID=UPI001F1B18CA|nr:error-prone DNA polymerase [Sphingomonas cannabina]UIJ45635.1 error-prone DNA polymerase [Sphingomonas cannabina]